MTSCNSFVRPRPADLAFLASGGCRRSVLLRRVLRPRVLRRGAVRSDAMADVAAAASNAMDMAIDSGCLRYTFDTAFPSRLLSSGSQMPAVRSRQSLTRASIVP